LVCVLDLGSGSVVADIHSALLVGSSIAATVLIETLEVQQSLPIPLYVNGLDADWVSQGLETDCRKRGYDRRQYWAKSFKVRMHTDAHKRIILQAKEDLLNMTLAGIKAPRFGEKKFVFFFGVGTAFLDLPKFGNPERFFPVAKASGLLKRANEIKPGIYFPEVNTIQRPINALEYELIVKANFTMSTIDQLSKEAYVAWNDGTTAMTLFRVRHEVILFEYNITSVATDQSSINLEPVGVSFTEPQEKTTLFEGTIPKPHCSSIYIQANIFQMSSDSSTRLMRIRN